VMTFLIPALYGLGLLWLEGLFILIFLTSMVSTVFGPALVSAVPLLVRRCELVSANALIQGTNNIGSLLGPTVSGILIAVIGGQYVLYVNAATFFISALCLLPIQSHMTLRANPKASAPGLAVHRFGGGSHGWNLGIRLGGGCDWPSGKSDRPRIRAPAGGLCCDPVDPPIPECADGSRLAGPRCAFLLSSCNDV
jgi:Major Facilitator Superfamily